MKKPILLCILDGWGQGDDSEHNAILHANTPILDKLRASCPHSLIDASAGAVGLPAGQMGNSEVGHTNIGAGRVVLQDLPKIDHAIDSGDLAAHPRLAEFINNLKQSRGTAHLMGLLSDGGVHSHIKHFRAMAEIIHKAGVPVAIHAFLDGRDTPPKSAQKYLQEIHSEDWKIATVSGRYFAMDRDNRWERIEKAYRAIVEGASPTRAPDAMQALHTAYALEQTDEFVAPTCLGDYEGVKEGDAILFTNFRADRARQILHALIDPAFDHFSRPEVTFADQLGMVEYSSALAPMIDALFPPESILNSLGEVVSKMGLNQLRIAETEKYAHVTFFFNGGSEEVYSGEDRILVASPDVATYDLQPEMSAPEVTEKLVEAIESGKYGLIVCNYANTDMVGHSGNFEAAVKAVEAVDSAIGAVNAAIQKAGGVILITADHGNAEKMVDEITGEPHTAHTTNLVPFIMSGDDSNRTLQNGVLADIAPTILELMELKPPTEMTGKSLLVA